MLNNLSVLIVDDDSSIHKILKIKLQSILTGAKFSSAADIAEAKEILADRSRKFDIIFLDQHLPDGVGAEIIALPEISEIPIIAMSSDKTPDLPGRTVVGGARFFITKEQISMAFFLPLVQAIIERSILDNKLRLKEDNELELDTIKTLVRTLQHEINNPLGALFGASYLLAQENVSKEDKTKAIELIEQSSKRIQNVLQKLVVASQIESVEKGSEELYQIPGDKNWK